MPLRIRKAEVFLVKIPFWFSVEHASASRTANVTGFCILSGEDGDFGVGEFLCREYVTGETLKDCMVYCKQVGPLLTRSVIEDPLSFIQSLWQSEPTQGRVGYAAFCGMELALLDLWGKVVGKPVAEQLHPDVLCGAPQDEPVAPATPPRWDRHPAHAISSALPCRPRVITYSAVYPFASGLKRPMLHFFYQKLMRAEHIKVKGTGNIEEDLAYIAAIRKAFSYPLDIRLDLNGSLSPEHAEEYCVGLLRSANGVRWIEQPFPKDDWHTHRAFQKRFADDLVFCADESLCSMEDLQRMIHEGAFRAINIRVGKNGGLWNSLRLYEKAIANGLEVQLGCLVGESSVLAYAGLHFSAVTDRLRYHEGCFGKYLIQWDGVQPSLMFSRTGQVSFDRLPKAGLVPSFDLAGLRRRAFQTTQVA